ncbi:30S ribosomal protein S16 [bacterium]|nr:30S ribosomal protein S16 [bacterium]
MAVVMRLKRMGATKKAFYRIVVMDSRTQRDGKTIDQLGYYDPKQKDAVIKIDKEKALHWLNVGAQPSKTVQSLLKTEGISLHPKE